MGADGLSCRCCRRHARSPYKTVQFYEALAAQGGGYRETQEQVRLFMLPNTQHCGGPRSGS